MSSGLPATPEIKPTENRQWVDFAKGVAIMLVVLYHSALFLTEVGLAGNTTRIRDVLLFYPMPMFFFIAGLTGRRMLTWTFPELWRRRLLPLVYLYILWSLIRVVFYLVVPHLRGGESAPTNPVNIALLPVLPTSSYWFIWALAIFTLLAWLLRRIPPAWQIGAAALLAIAATTNGGLDTDNVGWDRVAQNLVFFLAAIYIPRATYRFAARVRLWHVLALAVAYLAVAVTILLAHASRVPGVVILESVIAVALGIAASTLLVRVKPLGFVSTLGSHSFQIYLLHLFVIAAALWAVAPFAEYSVLLRLSVVLPFALATVALVASMYLFMLLRRVTWLWVSPFSIRRASKKRGAKVRSAPASTVRGGNE